MSISKQQELNNIISYLPPYCNDYFMARGETLEIKTRIAYATDLKVFFEYLRSSHGYETIREIPLSAIDSLTHKDIDSYINFLTEYRIDNNVYTNTAAGKKRKIASLKSFLKYLRKVEYIKSNPTEFVEIPKIKDKEIFVLSQDEQNLIYDEIEKGRNKTQRQLKYHNKTLYRDMAMLTLFLGTGIRVSELVGINDVDIDFREQRVLVNRKGGKKQFVYFGSDVTKTLCDYMDNERHVLLGYKTSDEVPENTPFFVSLQKSRISSRMVEIIIKEYAKHVLPLNVKVTPHTLRKTYGTKLYNEYRDLYLTQEALGHSSPATTAKYYTKFNEEYLKKLKEYNVK